MKISIIAAIGRNRELGKDNKLLWHIPEDMKQFRELTKGHVVIMGRKTFESIGRLLPSRTNIIVTRDKTFTVSGAVVVHSFEVGLERARKEEILRSPQDDNKREIFVIGGGQIYAEAMPFTDRLYLTIVDGEFVADTFFPDYSEFTKVLSKEKGRSGEYRYTFLELEK